MCLLYLSSYSGCCCCLIQSKCRLPCCTGLGCCMSSNYSCRCNMPCCMSTPAEFIHATALPCHRYFSCTVCHSNLCLHAGLCRSILLLAQHMWRLGWFSSCTFSSTGRDMLNCIPFGEVSFEISAWAAIKLRCQAAGTDM